MASGQRLVATDVFAGIRIMDGLLLVKNVFSVIEPRFEREGAFYKFFVLLISQILIDRKHSFI